MHVHVRFFILIAFYSALFLPRVIHAQANTPVYADSLPYLRTLDISEVEKFPSVSFGTGYAFYSPDFSGLQPIFDSAEVRWEGEGQSPSHYTVDFDISGMVSWWVTMKFNNHFWGTFEYGDSPTEVEVEYVALTLLYQVQPFGSRGIRPFAGAGWGRYWFGVEHNYGFRILRVEGQENGIHLTGGVEFLGTEGVIRPSIAAFGTLPLVEISSPEVDGRSAVVKMNTLMLGVRALFYF